ncbi:phytanoyl-CoA dioxygenase family protein [Pedobacter sp. KR3-3]|uniref:Phytanoyl-CoA dioxygenase family protein n=1 Tax=Pedobacter albus TaxID=3113905 RepID=A0ABU7I6M5_9SPHI|nr:phytanoyl-CoA dioxygenase family protein [Pedobacter sp. KR3-3]MEE1945132.1 phytanoyl-CoA dioxygenase family protein [Pedobacter sp. KR3-3]
MEKYTADLGVDGFSIVPNVFSHSFLEKINEAFEKSYLVCRAAQVKNGVAEITDGTLHHLLVTDPIYLELLQQIIDSPLYPAMESFFNGKFVLNTFGGVKNLKSKPSYVANIHRDIRFFSGDFPLMMQLLIMLDDFTIENGATFLLGGSHQADAKPGETDFYQKASRAIGKRGDVLLFNSNLWHAAGINTTDTERRALTINFTKPFMKPQLDYCRALGYDFVETLPTELQQVLGYFARVPSNLDEWYRKPEERFYRPNQS